MRRTAAVIGTAIFFVFVPCVVAGVVPWWISHWEFRLSFLGVELTRFVGSALILAGVSGLVEFIRAFRAAGARHASADRPDPTPRRYRPLSLCAQSNLRGGRRRHFRPGGPVWRLAAVRLRRGLLPRLPPVCRGLRGADAKKIIRGGIRSFPHQCAALDPAPDRVARRSVAAVAYNLGADYLWASPEGSSAKFVRKWPTPTKSRARPSVGC